MLNKIISLLEYFIPILSIFNYASEQYEIIERIFESTENTLILWLFTPSHASNRTLSLFLQKLAIPNFHSTNFVLYASNFKFQSSNLTLSNFNWWFLIQLEKEGKKKSWFFTVINLNLLTSTVKKFSIKYIFLDSNQIVKRLNWKYLTI